MLLNTFIYLLKGSIDPVTMQYNYIVCFTRMDTNSQYIIIYFFGGGGGGWGVKNRIELRMF